MIKVIQLDSYTIVVVERNPKYPLYKGFLECCKSSCNEDLIAFWKKKGNIQSRQMSISSTILFPLGLLRDPPRGSIPCQKLFYPKSDQEKIYISFVYTYYTYLHFL